MSKMWDMTCKGKETALYLYSSHQLRNLEWIWMLWSSWSEYISNSALTQNAELSMPNPRP